MHTFVQKSHDRFYLIGDKICPTTQYSDYLFLVSMVTSVKKNWINKYLEYILLTWKRTCIVKYVIFSNSHIRILLKIGNCIKKNYTICWKYGSFWYFVIYLKIIMLETYNLHNFCTYHYMDKSNFSKIICSHNFNVIKLSILTRY